MGRKDPIEVKFVISDMDGTLFDSEALYFDIWSKVLSRFNLQMTEEFYNELKGLNLRTTCRVIIQEFDLSISVDQIEEIVDKYASRLLPKVPLMPYADKVIAHIYNYGIPLALATSSPDRFINYCFTNHGWMRKCFHHIVSGSDDPFVKKGKPFPDIYLEAAKRFFPRSAKPEECLVFEDSPNGTKAAIDAGMNVIMINKPDVTRDFKNNVKTVITSFKKFRPELYGLPPWCSCNNH